MVRGGFGIMYERIQGNDMYNAGANIPFSLNVTNSSVMLENPSVLLATGTVASKPINPASITGLTSIIQGAGQLPVQRGHSAPVERRTVLSVSYVGNQNRFQNDYRQVNLPSESYLPALIGGAQYNTAPGLPYRGFHSINLSTNEANSHYDSLQVDLTSQRARPHSARVLHTLADNRSNLCAGTAEATSPTSPIPTLAGSTTTARRLRQNAQRRRQLHL